MKLKKAKNLIKNSPDFVKNNKRRIIVLIIFLLMILFNTHTSVKKMVQDKAVSSFKSFWETQTPVMNGGDNRELYAYVFNSQPGDFYRLSFFAKSDQNEKLDIVAKSFLENKQKIGSVALFKKDGEKYFEMVFKSSGRFQDIFIKRNPNGDRNTQEDNKIFICDFSLSRLGIVNQFEADSLDKTVFGKTEIVNKFLTGKKVDENIFTRDKMAIKQGFEFSADRVLFVDLKLAKMGDGGNGKYEMELFECDQSNKKTKDKILRKAYISPERLEKKLYEDGIYRFEFPAELEEKKRYCLKISNKDAKTDKKNYLKVKSFEENNSAQVRLVTVKLKKYNDNKILTRSKMEDLGSVMTYEYENNRYVTDLADIFEHSGGVKFDWYKNIVVAESKEGSYFTYRINTVHPLKRARVEAKQRGDKKDEIKLEYSYDNSNWKEIGYVQEKNEPQKFDYFIDNNENNLSEIYVRASYNRTKGAESSSWGWGLDSFKISAYLNKEKNEQ